MSFFKKKTALDTFWATMGKFVLLLIPAPGHTVCETAGRAAAVIVFA